MGRDEAYRVVQAAASEAMASGRHLREVLGDRVGAAAFSEAPFVAAAAAAVDHLAAITADWLREAGTGW